MGGRLGDVCGVSLGRVRNLSPEGGDNGESGEFYIVLVLDFLFIICAWVLRGTRRLLGWRA